MAQCRQRQKLSQLPQGGTERPVPLCALRVPYNLFLGFYFWVERKALHAQAIQKQVNTSLCFGTTGMHDVVSPCWETVDGSSLFWNLSRQPHGYSTQMMMEEKLANDL
jgi:hypothetical protein